MRCSSTRPHPGSEVAADRDPAARGTTQWRSPSSDRMPDEPLRRRRADAGRLAARCRRRCRRRWHDRAGRAQMRSARGAERVAGPLVAGHAEPPLARVPAGDRRTHGTRERGRRLVLDVAAGDVRISRPHRCRRIRGDRRAGVCRDAEGGIHGGRRIPLRASRSARETLCRSGGARASHRRCRRRNGHRAHAACRCSTRTPILAARRPRRGSGGSCTRSIPTPISSRRWRATPRGRSGISASRRTACAPSRRTSWRRSSRWLPPGAPIHIHAAEQESEVAACVAWSGARPVEWLLDHARRRCALVRRARDAHDGRRDAPPRRERRGRRSRADDRGGSRRRHVRGALLPRRAAARSASAATRTPASTRSRSCGSSSGRSGCRGRRATCSRPPMCRSARRSTRRRRAAARRRRAGGPARSRRDAAPISSCSIPTIRRWPPSAVETVLDAAVFGPCRAPVRDVMVGGRWVVRDGHHPTRTPCSRATARASRGSTHAHERNRVRPPDHRRASRDDGAATTPYGAIRDGAIGIRGETIAWVGAERDLPRDVSAHRSLDARGAWATPGLIDCHTHLVYAGNRVDEFEARLNGATYAEIARSGRRHQSHGAGNARRDRRRACRAKPAATRGAGGRRRDDGRDQVRLRARHGERIAAAPRGAARRGGRRSRRADHAARGACVARGVCRTRRRLHRSRLRRNHSRGRGAGLADAVDAFCDTIGFTAAQTRRVFAAARAHGLPVKLHADQLSDTGGAALAAEFGALSADHIEYTSDAGVEAMARAGTVAVLLPGAFYALRETRLPPIAALRARGVPMAIASDCNPGTSPATSLPLMLNMACTLFRLTPEEALAGVTRHAARALGLRRPRHACRRSARRHRALGHRVAGRALLPDRRQSVPGYHSRGAASRTGRIHEALRDRARRIAARHRCPPRGNLRPARPRGAPDAGRPRACPIPTGMSRSCSVSRAAWGRRCSSPRIRAMSSI